MTALGDYYRISWQLLILTVGALAVASEVVRPLVLIPFFLIAFFLVTPYGGNLGHNRAKLRFSLGCVLALLAANQIMRFEAFEDLVGIMIEMICGFLPLMLLNHDRPRSYWLSVLNVSVISVGSISFTSSVPVYLGFMLFVLLLMFNLNAANLHLPDHTGARLGEDLPRGYFRQFLYVLPAGILSAALIFVAFPRVQSFTMSLGKLMSKSRTGYSGAIELSGEGEIETSQAVALHVEARDKDWLKREGPSLLFRGDVLDTFDGVRWSSNVFDFKARDRAQDLRVAIRHKDDVADLTIHREPSPSTAIFYPGVLIHLLSRSANAGNFLVNANGSIIRDTYSLDRYTYSLRIAQPIATKTLPPKSIRQIAAGTRGVKSNDNLPYEMGTREVELYRALPADVRDAAWFAKWTAEVGLNADQLNLGELDAVLTNYFMTNFTWTLENKFSGANSLEAFLTKDRKGHCEYFATSAAMLLRSLGLATRVVVGFRGGTYNDLIDVLEVREENAHAWVEVYAPGDGWFAIDPTPPSPIGAPGVGDHFRTYVNAMSFWFRQYVIDYDQTTQRELVRSITNLGKKRNFDAAGLKDWAKEYGKPLAFTFVGVVAAVFLMRRKSVRARRSGMPDYYRRFLGKMRQANRPRQVGETYAAYHARLVAEGLDADLMDRLRAAIEQDLYAPEPTAEPVRAGLLQDVLALKAKAG